MAILLKQAILANYMPDEKLSTFLKMGSDWARLKTSIPGVFVLKLPAYKNNPARLAVELNPVDDSGSPTKKRGLVLRSLQELDEYREIFQYEKLSSLLKKLEEINPPVQRKIKAIGEDVLQI